MQERAFARAVRPHDADMVGVAHEQARHREHAGPAGYFGRVDAQKRLARARPRFEPEVAVVALLDAHLVEAVARGGNPCIHLSVEPAPRAVLPGELGKVDLTLSGMVLRVEVAFGEARLRPRGFVRSGILFGSEARQLSFCRLPLSLVCRPFTLRLRMRCRVAAGPPNELARFERDAAVRERIE